MQFPNFALFTKASPVRLSQSVGRKTNTSITLGCCDVHKSVRFGTVAFPFATQGAQATYLNSRAFHPDAHLGTGRARDFPSRS